MVQDCPGAASSRPYGPGPADSGAKDEAKISKSCRNNDMQVVTVLVLSDL